MGRSLTIRRLAPGTALAIAMLAVLAAFAPSARGHSAFVEGTPPPGSRLETSPARIGLEFTEPLNRALTKAQLVDARTGRKVATEPVEGEGRQLVLRPTRALASPAAYRVDWHTVSTLDGHALEGSFGLGVRTAAVGGAQRLEQSPLARDGWLRIASRAVFYAALLFFAGGLLAGLVTRASRPPWGWVVPSTAGRSSFAGVDVEQAERAVWRRTRAAGWVAAAAGGLVAVVETIDAADTLSTRAADAYLLSTPSGAARLAAVGATMVALTVLRRRWRVAAVAAAAALLAVAVGGHAGSASPRLLAIGADWLHLAGGAVWAGGIAHIVAAWAPSLRRMSALDRQSVIREVLGGFGRIAMPAFGVVVLAGLATAVLQLGQVQALWQTSYGVALAVKIALVGVIGALSYVHAVRLRPRLLAGVEASPRRERRHWRLLRSEPVVAGAAVAVAALLAVFPLPPRQLLEEATAGGDGGEQASAVPAPAPGELSVAEQAGPWIAAVWIRRDGQRLRGTVRLLDIDAKPVGARVRVARARQRGCGRGCMRFVSAPNRKVLTVHISRGASQHSARVPVRFDPRRTAGARALLRRAHETLDRADSFRIEERLSGGPGSLVTVDYAVRPPSRFRTTVRADNVAERINIGSRAWGRVNGGPWTVDDRLSPVDTSELLPARGHAQHVRFLAVGSQRGRRFADIALTDPGSLEKFGTPFWFRLRIDLATGRPTGMRMVAPGHFMRHRYLAFGEPLDIKPPISR